MSLFSRSHFKINIHISFDMFLYRKRFKASLRPCGLLCSEHCVLSAQLTGLLVVFRRGLPHGGRESPRL